MLVIVGPRQQPRAVASTLSAAGQAQISGPVQLEVLVSPPVVQPGDQVEVSVTLANHSQRTHMPVVVFRLPKGVSARPTTLPAGMTINLATRELHWAPVVTANGGRQQFALTLSAETADVNQPEQAITVILTLDGSSYEAHAGFWLGVPPQINAILSPPQAAVGQPVQLRAETAGSGPVTHVWRPGDGRRVEVRSPSVVYAAAGLYTIELEASNPLSAVTQTRSITIVPHPAAQFTPDDATPGVNQAVVFLNQSGGQPPLAFSWDFGDGVTSQEPQPTHQYNTPGVYQVHLTVQNDYGRSEAFWPVIVGNAPQADMIIPESVPMGQPMSGQAIGDETVTLFQWDMGDGHQYEGSLISHVYRRMGDFFVTVTASNEFGGAQIGRWIYIDAGLLNFFLPAVFKPATGGNTVVVAERPFDSGVGIDLPDVALDAPFSLEPLPFSPGVSATEQLFVYINEARSRFDLPPVNLTPVLSAAAQQHAADMAVHGYTGHLGSDGSTPAERLLWHRYPAAYAGEATAWGFEHVHQAVEFWINSPSHRRIVLNEFATDVGVGFTVDYNAPNVWYWTAEFGNAFGAPDAPALRLRGPRAAVEVLNTDVVSFSWNWPVPLAAGEQFLLYLHGADQTWSLGTVEQPRWGSYYTWQGDLLSAPDASGSLEWQVRLEQSGTLLAQSGRRALTVVPDPNLPTPTPEITPSPLPSPSPTGTATPTVTATPGWPTATPLPPVTPLPPLITATPRP